jgi:hypothetical protein
MSPFIVKNVSSLLWNLLGIKVLRRGKVDIASASGTEDPGSNPARV